MMKVSRKPILLYRFVASQQGAARALPLPLVFFSFCVHRLPPLFQWRNKAKKKKGKRRRKRKKKNIIMVIKDQQHIHTQNVILSIASKKNSRATPK